VFIAIEGVPGSGKSTLMGQWVLEDVLRGKPIACNKRLYLDWIPELFDCPPPDFTYTPRYPEILNFCASNRNGSVFVEEAGVMMRDKRVPEEILDLGAQARHLGMDFYLNYQNRLQINKEIFHLCQYVYVARRMFAGFPKRDGTVRGLQKRLSDFLHGGYLLAPMFRYLCYEPGKKEVEWGGTPVLDWKVWDPYTAWIWKKSMMVGKSFQSEMELKRAAQALVASTLGHNYDEINVR
jgi:hypothetical protein